MSWHDMGGLLERRSIDCGDGRACEVMSVTMYDYNERCSGRDGCCREGRTAYDEVHICRSNGRGERRPIWLL